MALIGSIKMALLNIFDIMSAIILSIAPCKKVHVHTRMSNHENQKEHIK